MRPIFLILFSIATACQSYSQYYLRGVLKDEQGNGLSNTRMMLFSKGTYAFFTGNNGVFGIPSGLKTDTITIIMEGYDTLKSPVITSQFCSLVLKSGHKKTDFSQYLLSNTQGFPYASIDRYDEADKDRSAFIKNAFVSTDKYSETLLGLHVNKSGYSKIRQQILSNHEELSTDEVKIEEMLNYFNLKPANADLPGINAGSQSTFAFNSQLTSCPWNSKSQLLFINLVANKINLDKTPPANIVFLIDASGSMDVINRLPLIKSAFKLFTENLRPIDKVSIVTYGDVVTELLPATSGAEKQKIIEAIEGLRPNGNTPGASAIRMAYAKARENYLPNGNNRIILATDGDFNVGETSAKGLVELAKRESKEGIYLSCLGVGIDKDDMVESLAKAGQGHYAYLENETDAEKILVQEFAQESYAVANNVFLDVQFNNSQVKEYRLIGFDNKRSAVYAKATDLQGGEAGSGQSLLVAFEIFPSGNGTAPVASVQLSYQLPNKSEITKDIYEAPQNFEPAEKVNPAYRFASAIIAFGEILKQSPYCKDFSWSDLENLATASATSGDLLQKEFTDLVVKARKLYPSRRRKTAKEN